ncbi:protein MEMO1-like isoform X2 [Teleopsis dalmanni]|uniref:protein MEMO1-like isoform X2 n=1 Tax=Teleopsis dalmanni TaxID=139649 RepID=UPI0018CEDBF3|nr:protein MEMO1-like isoform X2 [Teleopsis dalmanni]
MSSRKATHAGSWYSSSGAELSQQLDVWLNTAELLHGPARAIIAPHAGYAYCGECGAFAYRQETDIYIRPFPSRAITWLCVNYS